MSSEINENSFEYSAPVSVDLIFDRRSGNIISVQGVKSITFRASGEVLLIKTDGNFSIVKDYVFFDVRGYNE